MFNYIIIFGIMFIYDRAKAKLTYIFLKYTSANMKLICYRGNYNKLSYIVDYLSWCII